MSFNIAKRPFTRSSSKPCSITLMGELMVSIVKYWRRVGDLDNVQYSDLLNNARVPIGGDDDSNSESNESSDDSNDTSDTEGKEESDSDSDDSD